MKLQQTGLIALLALFLSFAVAVQAATSDSQHSIFSDDATAERLAPIGNVCIKGEECVAEAGAAPEANETAAATDAQESRSPESVFDSHCAMCHQTGAAGAPVFGNNDDWAAHIDKGKDTLYDSALHGFNAMPPRGMCNECSDDEILATVDYIVNNSGGSF